jgi:hypothetical protein
VRESVRGKGGGRVRGNKGGKQESKRTRKRKGGKVGGCDSNCRLQGINGAQKSKYE